MELENSIIIIYVYTFINMNNSLNINAIFKVFKHYHATCKLGFYGSTYYVPIHLYYLLNIPNLSIDFLYDSGHVNIIYIQRR